MAFNLTNDDIGRYVRDKETGRVGAVYRDASDGVLRIRGLIYEQQLVRQLEFVTVTRDNFFKLYRHYKGGMYRFLYEVKDCYNLGNYIVYGTVDLDKIWLRTKIEFYGEVSPGVQRFELIGD